MVLIDSPHCSQGHHFCSHPVAWDLEDPVLFVFCRPLSSHSTFFRTFWLPERQRGTNEKGGAQRAGDLKHRQEGRVSCINE